MRTEYRREDIIRQFVKVKNQLVTIQLADDLIAEEVEVIVLPIKKKNILFLNGKLIRLVNVL